MNILQVIIFVIIFLHINVYGKPASNNGKNVPSNKPSKHHLHQIDLPKHLDRIDSPSVHKHSHGRRHGTPNAGDKTKTTTSKTAETIKSPIEPVKKTDNDNKEDIARSKSNDKSKHISLRTPKIDGAEKSRIFGASTDGSKIVDKGMSIPVTGEEKKFKDEVENNNSNNNDNNNINNNDGGGYGSKVDNSWENKLNAALSEEDHMVDALHKKSDSVLSQEVKSSLPKSFMSQLLSPTVLKDMSSVASPIDFGGDSPPIPPEPTISHSQNQRKEMESSSKYNNNNNGNTKSRRVGPVHADVSSEHIEQIDPDDEKNNNNVGGDGGGGMIRLPQGIPGSVDEFSSGREQPAPPPPPPALPTSTSNVMKSSSSVNIEIGPTTVNVDIAPSDTVGDVALKATELAETNGGYEYDPGPLKYNGELLEDNLKFSSYHIPKNAKIRMSPHPKGTIVRHSNGVETKLRQPKSLSSNSKCLDFLPVRCLKWLASLPCTEEIRLAPIFLKQLGNKLPQTTTKHAQGLFKVWQVCPQHCSRCNDVVSDNNHDGKIKGRGWWKKVKSAIADTDDVVERHYDSFFLVFVSLLGVAGFCGLCLCCGFGNGGGGICSSFCCCCCEAEKSVEAPFQYSYSGYDFEDDSLDDAMMYS